MIGPFFGLLRALVAAQVDFVLVGGLSAVLRGAPVNTYDMDIVHDRSAENLARLIPILESTDAVFRLQPHRRLRPNESHLSGRGQDLTYEDLLPHSDPMELGDTLTVRVLRLEKLIELKEEVNDDKDRAVLPILRRTLEQIRRLDPPSPHDS